MTGRRDIRVIGKMCLNLFRLDSTLNWSRYLEYSAGGDSRGVNTGTGSTGGILGELILEQGIQGVF